MEATPRIELGMEVLQTSALPLGYVASAPKVGSDSTFAARSGLSSEARLCDAIVAGPVSRCDGAPAGGRRPDQREAGRRVPRDDGEQPGLDLARAAPCPRRVGA